MFALLFLAQVGDLSLAWEPPAGCPGREVLEREVGHLVGRTVAFGEPARLSVVVGVLEGERFTLSADITSALGTSRRTLVGVDCAEAVRALALVLALAIGDAPPVEAQARSATVAPIL